jgi:hypothetical protein
LAKELNLALLNTTSIHHFEPIFTTIPQLEGPHTTVAFKSLINGRL